jgi:nucleotide-binding universal stress UspA family protein
MRRILVATDFSPHAEGALEWAAALAQRFSAELELASSVYAMPFASAPGAYAPPADDLRAARAATERRLEAVVARLSAAGLRAHYTVLHEDPSSGICALASEKGSDLVALGTRGRSGLAHVLLGSVAERVARVAPCPVLTVHAEVSARPLRKLLVPSDFSDAAAAAFGLAARLVEPGGRLVVAHAVQPVLASGDPTLPLPDPQSEAWARGEFEKLCASLPGVSAEFDLAYAAPDAAVLDAAARHGADAIVMGTRGRTGLAHVLLGSVAERVIRRAPLPVITTRPR